MRAYYPVVARTTMVGQHTSERAPNVLRESGRHASVIISTCLVGEVAVCRH